MPGMLVMPVMCLQEKEGLRIASYRAINPQKKGTVFYNYCSSFVLGFERSSFVGVVMRLTSKWLNVSARRSLHRSKGTSLAADIPQSVGVEEAGDWMSWSTSKTKQDIQEVGTRRLVPGCWRTIISWILVLCKQDHWFSGRHEPRPGLCEGGYLIGASLAEAHEFPKWWFTVRKYRFDGTANQVGDSLSRPTPNITHHIGPVQPYQFGRPLVFVYFDTLHCVPSHIS